jgi:uncharacterized membrane protein
MRKELLFVHILSACAVIGGQVFRIIFVPLVRKTYPGTEGRLAIFLEARITHFVNICAATLLLISGYFLSQNFGGVLSQSWIWLSLILTVLSAVIIAVAGAQEENLAPDRRNSDWHAFFKLWVVEMAVSTASILMVLFFMISKSV